MRTCPNCSAELHEKARACVGCGAQLNADGTVAYVLSADPGDPTRPGEAPPARVHTARDEEVAEFGAHWFYWIAALSVVNTFMVWAGADIGLALGLGATKIADVFGRELGGAFLAFEIMFDLLIAGAFVVCGATAEERPWVFVIGMTAYALDGALVFLLGWPLGALLHLFVLVMLGRGYLAARRIARVTAPVEAESADEQGGGDE